MIHVSLGTKPEYLKTAPLLRMMKEQGIPFRLIDTGQHADLVKSLYVELAIHPPDIKLQDAGNVDRVRKAILWFLRHFITIIFHPSYIRQTIFNGERGICLVHGDTLSTLLGTLMAKRAGLKVAHLEAGLSSKKLFRPFPEELCRRIVTFFADYLFVPGEKEEYRLRLLRPAGHIINTGMNTGLEELYQKFGGVKTKDSDDKYAVITFHRVETIIRRKSIERMVEIIERVSEHCRPIVILHPPTAARLIKFSLLDRLQSIKHIVISAALPHPEFIKLLSHAEFVATDGGGIQEECAFMGIPTLLLREETERHDGLGRNVFVSGLDLGKVSIFLSKYRDYRFASLNLLASPSAIVLRELLQLPTPFQKIAKAPQPASISPSET